MINHHHKKTTACPFGRMLLSMIMLLNMLEVHQLIAT